MKRCARLHAAVSLLEAACVILERSTIDGVTELHPKVNRWCKQIRNEQQLLFGEMNRLEKE